MTNPSLKNTRWIIKVAFPKLPALNFREVVCKKNRPSNDGATADHSQKHRHFAIFLVSKPQDHSGNNHKPRISQNQNGFFRLSTNSFSSDGSSMQFSGAGLVRQVIPRERFPNLQPAHGTNDKTTRAWHSTAPLLLAFLPSTWQGTSLLVPILP